MPVSAKVALGLAAAASLGTALLLAVVVTEDIPIPPGLPPTAPRSQVGPEFPAVLAKDLMGPWPKVVEHVVAMAPAPTVASVATPAPVIDRQSLRFIGSLVDTHDQKVFLFKNLANGSVLPLVEGVDRAGWKLTTTSPLFRVQGPGGLYEIARP